MEYDKDNLVLDFAKRTKKNLEFIETYSERKYPKPDCDVYEVTQFINSLLGLLVFPQKEFYDDIPETPLNDLVLDGWPEIKSIYGKLPHDNLKELLRYLRNGISHFNVEFVANDNHSISGLRIWNIPFHSSVCDWKVELSLNDLKKIVNKFIELIEKDIHYKLPR